jgi:hypothetical protein
MARGRAGEQRPNCVDGLPAAANHAAYIALSKLKSKNGCSAAWNFRKHHVVGIFDQLPNNELKKFSHDEKITTNAPSHNAAARQMHTNRHGFLPESAQRLFDYLLQVCVGSPPAVSAPDGSGGGVASVRAGAGATGGSDAASAGALAACFLFFLIKLRTVSDVCAPLLIQYSARSSFNVLL